MLRESIPDVSLSAVEAMKNAEGVSLSAVEATRNTEDASLSAVEAMKNAEGVSLSAVEDLRNIKRHRILTAIHILFFNFYHIQNRTLTYYK